MPNRKEPISIELLNVILGDVDLTNVLKHFFLRRFH